MAHYNSHDASRDDSARAKIYKAVKYGDPALLRRTLFNMEPRERASALATQTLYARGRLGQVCNIICTPLVAAAEYGHLLCVKLLLYFYADVEGNNTFWTPLFAAVAGGYLDIMNCLVENGADVNARTYDNCTPLIRASALGDIDVVTFLVEHGANVNLQDKDGETALHYAIRHRRNSYTDVLSCLIKHGADVNERSNDYLTPLMLASKYEEMNAATLLVEHGADINLQDRNGETALFFGIDESVYRVKDVLKYLVENGADVNSRTAENSTPLMIASLNSSYAAMEFLVENGASLDLQDKNGDTALHYAVRGNDIRAINTLGALDAPKLLNKNGLTPLLYASNALMISIVEEFAGLGLDEEEIDALELLGASLATQHFIDVRGRHTEKTFGYMKRGLKERFNDPSDPIIKKPMEPAEAYQNRKECQTLEELAQIEGDVEAILMESLIIRERILGADNVELLGPIQELADWHKRCWNFDICMGLQSHAMKIAQQRDHSIESQLHSFISVIYQMVHNNYNPKRKIILKVLEQTALEYEKQTEKMTKDLEGEPPSDNMKQFLDGVKKQDLDKLLDSLLRLLQIFVKVELCGEEKELNVPELLQKPRFINPHDSCGNTLLHLSVQNDRSNLTFYYPPPPFEFPCAKTIQLLLNVGINVDAINSNGDTPLHIAVAFTSSDKSHLLTDMLKVLLDGGARDDFVNNDGKTAMDVARTEEARRILAAVKKLQ